MECPTPYGLILQLIATTYLLQLIREKYIIFMDTFFKNITRAHFIFYAHVVDAPTHPAPYIVIL